MVLVSLCFSEPTVSGSPWVLVLYSVFGAAIWFSGAIWFSVVLFGCGGVPLL
jgi:hypothetical protein